MHFEDKLPNLMTVNSSHYTVTHLLIYSVVKVFCALNFCHVIPLAKFNDEIFPNYGSPMV